MKRIASPLAKLARIKINPVSCGPVSGSSVRPLFELICPSVACVGVGVSVGAVYGVVAWEV